MSILEAIFNWLVDALVWVVDLLEWVVVRWATMIFDAIIAVLSLIPVPAWLTNLSGTIADIDPGVAYFLAPFQFGTGFAWMLSALLIRFLIRRIPFVG